MAIKMLAISQSRNDETSKQFRTGECLHPVGYPSGLSSKLDHTTVQWSLVGDLTNPVIAILGGISAHRYVCTKADTNNDSQVHNKGWWDPFVGKDQVINTDKYAILSMNYLFGNEYFQREHAAQNRKITPIKNICSVSTSQQADALNTVLEHLQIGKLHSIVGCSYGGMVALAFARKFPLKLNRQLVISAAHESHPRSWAIRSIQRQIVHLGQELGEHKKGLNLARQLGMVSYRSIEEFGHRFKIINQLIGNETSGKIECYLQHKGQKFADHFHPDAFLTLSNSIDSHFVDPEQIFVPTWLVAVDSDELVFASQIEQLAKNIQAPTTQYHIQSYYGHDAFLKDVHAISDIINQFLGDS